MAKLTKKIIAEQVLYKIYGQYTPVSSPIKEEDVIKAAEQKINLDFKAQHFQYTMANGDTIPDGTIIATYDGIAVTEYNQTKSIATLPVQPISLPRNMGIWEIYDINNPQNLFIPLLPQQANLLRSQPLINDLLGQVGYTPYGKKIIFEINLPLINITSVSMRLLVMDMSTYEDTDYLNLPSDYEVGLIEYLVASFDPVRQGEKIGDAYSKPQMQR